MKRPYAYLNSKRTKFRYLKGDDAFSAQSTPQTYRSRAGVRRQSSVGPLNDTSPLTGGGGGGGEAVVSTPAHSATLPVSSLSASSYYTNASPSPPAAVHVSCDDILAPAPARAPACRSAPHSATNLHQPRPAALALAAERAHHAAHMPPQVRSSSCTYHAFILYPSGTYIRISNH